MGNMWNCIIFDTKIKDGEKLCTLKNKEGTITYFEDIPEEKFDDLLDDIEKKAKKEGKIANEYLEVIRREQIYAKHASKFLQKFHMHFDGELILRKVGDLYEVAGAGGHNHLVIGHNIQVRRYLTNPIDDVPFDTLINIRYKNGQWIDKVAKSSMFPINWDIKRVKEEIALVYDAMLESGIFESVKMHRSPQFRAFDSSGKFKIKIEFDSSGNITNSSPII